MDPFLNYVWNERVARSRLVYAPKNLLSLSRAANVSRKVLTWNNNRKNSKSTAAINNNMEKVCVSGTQRVNVDRRRIASIYSRLWEGRVKKFASYRARQTQSSSEELIRCHSCDIDLWAMRATWISLIISLESSKKPSKWCKLVSINFWSLPRFSKVRRRNVFMQKEKLRNPVCILTLHSTAMTLQTSTYLRVFLCRSRCTIFNGKAESLSDIRGTNFLHNFCIYARQI